jgi:hypothetical protein
MYVNKVFAVFDTPPTVTTTLAVPALPAGVVQFAEVAEATLKAEQEAPPTVMPEAPVKLVPAIVIPVPPATDPDVGEIDVTVGPIAPDVITRFPTPVDETATNTSLT